MTIPGGLVSTIITPVNNFQPLAGVTSTVTNTNDTVLSYFGRGSYSPSATKFFFARKDVATARSYIIGPPSSTEITQTIPVYTIFASAAMIANRTLPKLYINTYTTLFEIDLPAFTVAQVKTTPQSNSIALSSTKLFCLSSTGAISSYNINSSGVIGTKTTNSYQSTITNTATSSYKIAATENELYLLYPSDNVNYLCKLVVLDSNLNFIKNIYPIPANISQSNAIKGIVINGSVMYLHSTGAIFAFNLAAPDTPGILIAGGAAVGGSQTANGTGSAAKFYNILQLDIYDNGALLVSETYYPGSIAIGRFRQVV